MVWTTSDGVIRCSAPALTQSTEVLWWLRHPRTAPRPRRPLAGLACTLAVLGCAPRVTVELTDGPGGRRIDAFLRQRRFGIRRRFYARSMLTIPVAGQPLFSGRPLQAARTNMRRARDTGLTCAEVWPTGARPGERIFQLLDVAGDQAGRLHVTVDRDWALIHVCMSDVAVGFYLLHGHVVAELQRCGVRRVLIDSGMAVGLKPGHAYMQGRLGYEVVNVRPALRVAPTSPG